MIGFFQCTAFIVACGDSIRDLLAYNKSFHVYCWDPAFVRLIAAIFCVPATYLRSLKSAAKLSLIATVAAVIMLVCLLIQTGILLSDGRGMGEFGATLKLMPDS